MKKKFFVLFTCLACMQTLSAQNYYESESDIYGLKDPNSPFADVNSFSHEVSFYIQDGWGIGYQLRKDISKYVGWNIFGVSYMTGFNSPADHGWVNFKVLGVRAYTPAFNFIRGYVDLNLGYTLTYNDQKGMYYYGRDWYYYDDGTKTKHYFGMDCGVGVQIGRHFTVGYNMNFLTPDKIKTHWAKISYIF